MKKKLNVFDKLKWKGDEAIADGSDIVDLVQDNPDLFEEVGGKQGVGIYLAEDGNYVYIVHFFYGDTAFSDWEHSAKLYRVDQETEQFCEDYKVYHTRHYKIVDGWEICRWSSSWVFNFNRLYFLDDSWRKRCRNPIVYREQAAIHELLNMLINTPRDYGYYFSKTHKHDQPKELDNLEFQVIYSTPGPSDRDWETYSIVHGLLLVLDIL